MSIVVRYAMLSFAVLGSLATAVCGRAELPADVPSVADANADAKQQVLRWIDRFREDQVLFHDEDIGGLRDTLAEGSTEEAVRWWYQTASSREAMETQQWKETHQWFGEFLKVQAILSDDEIDGLRTRAWNAAGQASSRAFREVLEEVATYRKKLSGAAAGDRALRESSLRAIANYRKQTSGRVLVAQAAGFATNRPPVKPREPTYTVPPPLVTSRQVARWNVTRLFWWW